jgi:hypothetical protein
MEYFDMPTQETFAVRNRIGNIVGKSSTVRGAMQAAPAKGDMTVRGEYTSDGTYWGIGKGRVVAQRENGRWLVG